jgi:hypothetical protein
MSKNRMVAILVCLVFVLSLAPVLISAEQKPIVPSNLQNLKISFRLLSYIFPLLSTFSDLPSDRGRSIEKIDNGKTIITTSKSTDEATSIDPKTKD